MSQLHVELVDALLALANVEEKDEAFVRDYFVDIAADSDATTLAHKVLSSVAGFLESRSSLSELQRRVIKKLLDELQDQSSSGTISAIEHCGTVPGTPSPLLDSNPSTQDAAASFAGEDPYQFSNEPDHVKDRNTGLAIDYPADHEHANTKETVEANRLAWNKLQNDSGIIASRMRSCGVHGRVNNITQGVGNVSLDVPAQFSSNTNQKEPTPQNGRDLEKTYPFGHKLISSLGWSAEQGLGPDGTGIKKPIHHGGLHGCNKNMDETAGLGHPNRKNPGKRYASARHVSQPDQETRDHNEETEDDNEDDKQCSWDGSKAPRTSHAKDEYSKEYTPEVHEETIGRAPDSLGRQKSFDSLQTQTPAAADVFENTSDRESEEESAEAAQPLSRSRRNRYTGPSFKRRAGFAKKSKWYKIHDARKRFDRGTKMKKEVPPSRARPPAFTPDGWYRDEDGECKPNLYDSTRFLPKNIVSGYDSPDSRSNADIGSWPDEEYLGKSIW
ncbi:hypothetical protein F5X99DRAFT_407450 [Biscogniauxia marginata]|nr:hypothetical protein F5X99DRAFT_407450 [Biscogniauxia marginata]